LSEERVREVLHEIATRPVAQWPTLLARRFPDDPLMVQQGLLWLYAEHQHLESRSDRPSLGHPGDERYELSVRLDSGATASVWQAYDRKLARNVAIKVLHDVGEPAALAQVISEARAACDLSSDHVVRIHDVHDDQARPYIVMELVAEYDPEREQLVLGTAASSCRPRSIDEVAQWVASVARGVHDAHLRNVFHRDLKPDNVLITPISRIARIADFGLAVSIANEDSDPSAASLVKHGLGGPTSVSGTPEYMAPEQARGLPLQLDPRAATDRRVLLAVDVWGLGALAYDLLSGTPPWCAGDGELEPWEIAASGARPPRLRRTANGRRIPKRLRRIVEKAIALDPDGRYETAGQVANELEAYLARRPTSFDRARTVRLGLWSRRNPQLTLAGLIAIALVLLVLGTRATVKRLRRQRNALNVEVASQRADLDSLTSNVEQTRAKLTRTVRELSERSGELQKLETTIGGERKVYETVLKQKEAALQEATATTRQLVDQLEDARRARESADEQRALAERSAATARQDADRASKDRDRVRRERDQVRVERDQLERERDAAMTERDQARRDLERLQREIARLAAGRPPSMTR
jgi:serine/threonine protein kinase